MEDGTIEIETQEKFFLEKKIIALRLEDMKAEHIIENYELKKWHGDENEKIIHIDIFFKYKENTLEVGSLIYLDYANKNTKKTRLALYKGSPKDLEFKIFILSSIAERKKGYDREEKLFDVIKELKKEYFVVDGFSYNISSVTKTNEFFDNKLKIDFFVRISVVFGNLFFQKHSFEIPIQCKSSVRGQKYHKEKYPEIPSIAVLDKNNNFEIKEKISQLIKNWLILKSTMMIEKVFLLSKTKNAQDGCILGNIKKLRLSALEKIHQ